jgi:hypothetical protein
MFIVIRERFKIISPDTAIKLARKYTQNLLDIIVNDIQDKRIFSLLMYLISNATILDLNTDTLVYQNPCVKKLNDTEKTQKMCRII